MAARTTVPPRGGPAEKAIRALVGPLERLDARLLAALPEGAMPPREARPVPAAVAPESALGWLESTYALSDFEVDVILLAVAPELDRRYEHVFAQLSGDARLRRPTVDVALRLLCATALERVEQRARFAAGAPLLRHGLVSAMADPAVADTPLLSRLLVPDPQVVALLLDEPGVDARLAGACRLVDAGAHRGAAAASEARLVAALAAERLPAALPVLVRGGDGVDAMRLAAHVAGNAPLLEVDCRALDAVADAPAAAAVALALRESRFHGAVPVLTEADALWPQAPDAPPAAVVAALAEHSGVIVLAVGAPRGDAWARLLPDAEPLDVAAPGVAARRDAWKRELRAAGTRLAPADLDALAARFRLGTADIAAAVGSAARMARRRATPDGGDTSPGRDDVFAAARGRAGHELARLARKVELSYGFDDLVLPSDRVAQLRELLDHVAHRVRVYDEWGFARKHPQSAGVSALFAGPPGTGKSMAAAVIARELALDLYRIDLSSVVSKYVGETERNLDRVFTAAERSNAILFFDEADALFGRRTEIRDAHDRYANIEVSYLLQRIDDYDGVVVLASNLRNNIDRAFARRIRFTIEFPLPGEAERLRIWRGVWPDELPRDPGIDLADLAARFDLTGSGIRNAVVSAAFLAAADGGRVSTAHLLHAIRREYENARRVTPDGVFDVS